MTEPKYLVYNAAHWEAAEDAALAMGEQTDWGIPAPLEDCVVIRLQDKFAAAGLHGYASTIQSLIEVAKEAGIPLPAHLEEIRDYFFDMAIAAEKHPNKKFPD